MNITNFKEFESQLNNIFEDDTAQIQKKFIKLFNIKKNQKWIEIFISNPDNANLFDYMSPKYKLLINSDVYLKLKIIKVFISLLIFEETNLKTRFLFDVLLSSICADVISSFIRTKYEYEENSDILSYLLFNIKKSSVHSKIMERFKSAECFYGSFHLNMPKHNKLLKLILNNIKLNNNLKAKNNIEINSIFFRHLTHHVNIYTINSLINIKNIGNVIDFKIVQENKHYQQVQNEILYNCIETYISYNYHPKQKEDLLAFLIEKQIKFYDHESFFPEDKFLNIEKNYYRIIETNVKYFDYTENKINYIIDQLIKMQGKFNFCNDLLIKELFRCGLSNFFINFFEQHYNILDKSNLNKFISMFQSKSFIEELNNRSPLFGMTQDYKEQQKYMGNYLNKINLEHLLKEKKSQIKRSKI